MQVLQHEALAVFHRRPFQLLDYFVVFGDFKLELVDDSDGVLLLKLLVSVLSVLLPQNFLHVPFELELDRWQHHEQHG